MLHLPSIDAAQKRFYTLLVGLAFWHLTDEAYLDFDRRYAQASTVAELAALENELLALLPATA